MFKHQADSADQLLMRREHNATKGLNEESAIFEERMKKNTKELK